MNLECLCTVIPNNLAINIDLTDSRSWINFTGYTLLSTTKWVGAVSDNIDLIDFGLTEFDNGRTSVMWSGITLTPSDTYFSMHRVGYNEVVNPSSGNTSGYTATTRFDLYPMTGITASSAGNYFNLNGGYFQGFFELDKYNYRLFPHRYNNGITIETLVCLYPQSHGIFFMIGARAEDKYNQYFSGETTTGGTIGNITTITGVTTSEDNTLNAFYEVEVNRNAFADWGARKKKEYKEYPAIDNVKSNAIAFLLTEDKKLAYRYIDENGLIIENSSITPITTTGFAIFSITYVPDSLITDPAIFDCAPRRTGKLTFYLNGRSVWTVKDFPEFYFHPLYNQKEKQIGVPYSISWGGGSFGLKHSWHYDYQTYGLYTSQDTQFINNNFWVQNDPLGGDCRPTPTDDYLPGLSFSADSTTFSVKDKCNPTIETPVTVMRVEYTGTTGTSATTYFIKFNHPISVLSNREYTIDLSFYNSGFFKLYDINGNTIYSRASIVVYGSVDVDIISEVVYSNPLTAVDILNLTGNGLHPFPDRQEYQYMLNGVMYYGATGLPVALQDAYLQGLIPMSGLIHGSIATGEDNWAKLQCVFKTQKDSGKQQLYIGLLLESTEKFEENVPIFLSGFTYTGADILAQDPRKNNLLIQQNFDDSFIGGIQKLRVYNNGLTPAEILHNAIIESKMNPFLVIKASTGGRIISSYGNPVYIPQESSGSDIEKSVRYRNSNGTYKNLYQMIDIFVVIKSRSNPSVELVKFKKVAAPGWIALIYINDTTYNFIIPNTITSQHPNEMLFAEIKFQWVDPLDIDGVFDKIFVVDITTRNLLNNTVKYY